MQLAIVHRCINSLKLYEYELLVEFLQVRLCQTRHVIYNINFTISAHLPSVNFLKILTFFLLHLLHEIVL